MNLFCKGLLATALAMLVACPSRGEKPRYLPPAGGFDQPVTLTLRTTMTTWERFRSEIYGLTSACYSMYCIAQSLASRCRKISPLSLIPCGR